MSNCKFAAHSQLSPTRRLTEDLAAVRAPEYGSALGRLHANNTISEAHYAAGKDWLRLTSEYDSATLSPRRPVSVSLETTASCPPDPDSDAGRKIARQHSRTVASYTTTLDALRKAGREVERVTNDVVIHDTDPTAFELALLKRGLDALLQVARRKAASR